jgi:hypothetical protein
VALLKPRPERLTTRISVWFGEATLVSTGRACPGRFGAAAQQPWAKAKELKPERGVGAEAYKGRVV